MFRRSRLGTCRAPLIEMAGTSPAMTTWRARLKTFRSNNPEALALGDHLVDLLLCQPPVADDLRQVILDLAQHVDGLPQPLARVGVAELAQSPLLDVARLERREGLLQMLVSQE